MLECVYVCANNAHAFKSCEAYLNFLVTFVLEKTSCETTEEKIKTNKAPHSGTRLDDFAFMVAPRHSNIIRHQKFITGVQR